MTWAIEGETDNSWSESAPLVPDGVCIAGLIIPGEAVAGVGYGFLLSEDTAVSSTWTE